MYEYDDDIVETNHCVDDECPVNDLTKEDALQMLQDYERREQEEYGVMQQTAIDTYFLVLRETGDHTQADKAFRKIYLDYYGRN